MITFTPLGNRLLTDAVGDSKGRAAGDYLTAIMQRRYAKWTQGLGALRLVHRASSASILRACKHLHGYDPCAHDMLGGIAARVPKSLARNLAEAPEACLAFCHVLEEYNAGNCELIAALQNTQEEPEE